MVRFCDGNAVSSPAHHQWPRPVVTNNSDALCVLEIKQRHDTVLLLADRCVLPGRPQYKSAATRKHVGI